MFSNSFLGFNFFTALCKASSIQVSLLYGHIVVKIVSNGAQMILTSLQRYSNGANHFFSLSLTNSSLILKTSLEETRVAVVFIESEDVFNHTNIFLCGVPDDLVNETGQISNFTGCAALSSRVLLDPLPLSCNSYVQQRTCSYCLNEVCSYCLNMHNYTDTPIKNSGNLFSIILWSQLCNIHSSDCKGQL